MAVAPVYYRPKSFTLTDQYYKQSVEAVATFNTRIRLERNARLPFIDSHTGLAQNSSLLWHPYRNRDPGSAPGQIYSYPVKRWKKKRRAFNFEYNGTKNDLETGASDMHQISAVENPAATETPTIIDTAENSKEKWYEEADVLSEPLDAGEIDDRNSDSSDFEETYVKRRKKKKPTPKRQSRKKANKEEPSEFDDKEKPYSCDTCGARYKTRPGLTYHLTHSHMSAEEVDEDSASSSKAPTPTGSREPSRGTRSSSRNNNAGSSSSNNQSSNNSYCDFCLGDENENKKTGGKEELVSCGDCGRSGHPTCLQFTANMIISVKKYRWQCIECKSCGLCGTSDNDEQLLFCDDCDRGYHMYCLNPPLSEPPEGSWSCHLCIEEFYGGKKPPGMQ